MSRRPLLRGRLADSSCRAYCSEGSPTHRDASLRFACREVVAGGCSRTPGPPPGGRVMRGEGERACGRPLPLVLLGGFLYAAYASFYRDSAVMLTRWILALIRSLARY